VSSGEKIFWGVVNTILALVLGYIYQEIRDVPYAYVVGVVQWWGLAIWQAVVD
jgi:hypothetical protein